jgi:hypothetical protein
MFKIIISGSRDKSDTSTPKFDRPRSPRRVTTALDLHLVSEEFIQDIKVEKIKVSKTDKETSPQP